MNSKEKLGRCAALDQAPTRPPAAAQHLLRILASTNVEDVLPVDKKDTIQKNCFFGNNVCVLASDERVPRAFKKMCEASYFSCPVVGSAPPTVTLQQTPQRYLGDVDMSDFVSYLIGLLNVTSPQDTLSEEDMQQWLLAMPRLDKLEMMSDWQTATVWDVMDASGKTGPMTVACCAGMSLLAGVELLSKLHRQRVTVINTEGHIESILTASMCISLLSQYMDVGYLDELINVPVSDMMASMTCSAPCCPILHTELAVEAFRRMDAKNTSALPVINPKGELVDIISKRDLKLIGYGAERIRLLARPVAEFKGTLRVEEKRKREKERKREEERKRKEERKREEETERKEDKVQQKAEGEKKKDVLEVDKKVEEMKTHVTMLQSAELRKTSKHPPSCVTANNTLKDVIRAMRGGRLHQLVLVREKEGKVMPVGLVTQLDVLEYILHRLGFQYGVHHDPPPTATTTTTPPLATAITTTSTLKSSCTASAARTVGLRQEEETKTENDLLDNWDRGASLHQPMSIRKDW